MEISTINTLIELAKSYRPDSANSIARNDHMNALKPNTQPTQDQIDAVLADYLNYVAGRRGMDLGLYTCDLGPALAAALAPPTAEDAAPQWVPVSERLPEPDPQDRYRSSIPVLVHLAKGPQDVPLITKAFYSHQGECWEHCLSPMGWACNEITHWMPLPAAPVTPTGHV